MPERALGADDHIVVGGASGLIGRTLVRSLRASGVRVTRLVRSEPAGEHDVRWRPGHPDGLSPDVLEGARAVIILNGLSIGDFPWPRGYRSELVASRLDPQYTLAKALERMNGPRPRVLIASAAGIYGSTGGAEVDESGSFGAGWLSQLAVRLERASSAISDTGAAVALLRIAPIVHPDAVLRPMVTLTRLGVAGPLGSGRQVWPWVSLPDTIGAIRHTLVHEIDGPVNITGPTRAVQNDLGFALARGLNRPYLLRAPAWALRLVLRELADELLLVDAHVVPRVLQETGYEWKQRTVEAAVEDALSKP